MHAEPQTQHAWLQKFVGEWSYESQARMPDGQAVTGTGTQSTRAVGGFWVMGHGEGEMPGAPAKMTMVITLGFDPAKGKFVGTWNEFMTAHYRRTK